METRARDTYQLLVDHIVAGQADFYRLAFSYVKNRDAALDVVQEAVVKALSKVDTLREPAYLKTWFYRILLHESMNYFRSQRGTLSFEDVCADAAAPPARDPGERLDLYDAIDRLPDAERAVIRLRFFEDLKLDEIAQVTRANLNTVKSRLYKGLRRLKELTGEELRDE